MGAAKIHRFDTVKIVNYGAWLMVHKDHETNYPVIEETEYYKIIDIMPDLVGQHGVVTKISGGRYALSGPDKIAWYERDQLELVLNRNNYDTITYFFYINQYMGERPVATGKAPDPFRQH